MRHFKRKKEREGTYFEGDMSIWSFCKEYVLLYLLMLLSHPLIIVSVNIFLSLSFFNRFLYVMWLCLIGWCVDGIWRKLCFVCMCVYVGVLCLCVVGRKRRKKEEREEKETKSRERFVNMLSFFLSLKKKNEYKWRWMEVKSEGGPVLLHHSQRVSQNQQDPLNWGHSNKNMRKEKHKINENISYVKERKD